MKLKSILIKLLILALGITSVFALTSCLTSSAIVLGSCIACNKSCDDGADTEPRPRDAVTYRLEDDGESYYVSQIEDVSEVEILSEYKGKPVKRIAYGAFSLYRNTGCGSEPIYLSIYKLTLPASITEVSGRIYSDDASIYEINYLGSLTDWCNLTGGSYLFTGNTRLMIGGSLVSGFTAPAEMTAVPESLFDGYRYLSEVNLHDNITLIGERAFDGCWHLKDLTLPQNEELIIGEKAFRGCSSLEKVVIPAGVKALQSSTFEGCSSLKTVEISGVIEEIGYACFSGCVKLESVDLSNATIGSIVEKTFSDCRSMCTFVIPESVKFIAESAFESCKIYEVYDLSGLAKSATHLGGVAANAVVIHESLEEPSVVVTDGDFRFLRGEVNYLVTYFGSGNRLELPEGVNGENYAIVKGLFENSSLVTVKIPEQVTAIGAKAFNNCGSLTAVTGGQGVESIGKEAFAACKKLTKIEFGGSLKTVGQRAFAETAALESIKLTCEELCENAFENSGLVFAELTVKNIRHAAFKNCKYLSEVTLNEGVETVDTGAFMDCVSLKKLDIPSTVTKFGGQSGLKMLEEISVAEGNEHYTCAGNCLIETESKTLVLGCKNSSIPDDGSVEIIGDYAFYGSEIVNVLLPESVKEVGWAAFRDSSVESINLGGVEKIENYAFANCVNLQDVEFSDNLTLIDSYAFYRCESIVSVVIPDSVTSLGSDAFANCSNLTRVTLSKSLKRIYDSVFYNCESLTSIAVPEGVTEIGRSAFYGCASLYEATLPSTLKAVKDYAFYRCESLMNVTIPETAVCERDAFPENTNIEYSKAAVQ